MKTHKSFRKTRCILQMGITLLGLTLAGKAGAQVLYSQDFQSLNVGDWAGQDSWVLITPPSLNNAAAQVIDSGGNKYGQLSREAGQTGDTRMLRTIPGTSSDTSNNVFTFDLLIGNVGTNAFESIWNFNGGPEVASNILITDTRKFFYNSGGTYINSNVTLNTDEWYRIKVTLTPTIEQYAVAVTRLSDSVDVVSASGINYVTPVTVDNIRNIEFFAENAASGTLFSLDNISIVASVPEPSSTALSLFGMACGTILLLRRRAR